jgi:hypothetical protein
MVERRWQRRRSACVCGRAAAAAEEVSMGSVDGGGGDRPSR